MRSRLRTGAAAAVVLGALLLATVLASPALAWHSNVSVETKCLDNGNVGVHYTVTSWEEGHEATVYVFYKLDNGEGGKLPTGHFGKEAGESSFEGEFELPPEGSATTVTVVAVAKWTDDQTPSKNEGSAKLPDEKCKGGEESSTTTSESTTSTSKSTTTTTPSSSETSAPTTSIEETTTTAEVGAATSTTAGGGQLPFTGANSGPMLLAGIVLVAGGSLFLLLTRSKDGHATK
jgi:LPXTG-motif cell wall-anchored protein